MKKQKKKKEEGPVTPEDDILVFHILPRLPVKSLFRFKCVCKKWRRWISRDPTFMREQSRFSMAASSSSGGFIDTGCKGGLEFISTGGTPFHVPDPSLKFLKVSSPRILASCNGLLCVESLRKSISVCNPVTKQQSRIPDTKQKGLFGLAFEPLDSFQAYKLVCLHETRMSGKGEMEFGFKVFSSDTGSWTTSREKVVVKEYPDYPCCPTFVGGILYWNLPTRFIWFDPQRDVAGLLMHPPSEKLSYYTIGVWKEELTYTRILGNKIIETWILSEFKWTRIFQASLVSEVKIAGNYSYFLQRWSCNCFVLPYQGGENLYFAVWNYGRKFDVCCYKMKTGELTKLYACRKWPSKWLFFPYKNNFIPLPKQSKFMQEKRRLSSTRRCRRVDCKV